MSEEIRAGLIGCGGLGGLHAAGAQQVEGLKFAAYADRDRKRAEKLADQYHGEYADTDPQRLIADASLQTIFICTHHDSHAPLAIAAAQAGKHIFMEKPMAMTVADCHAIEHAVTRAGVQFQVGFKFRHAPMVKRVRQFLPHPIITVGQVIDPPWPDDLWAQDPATGGGNILSQGCHNFDLVCFLTDSKPVSLCANGGAYTHHDQAVPDNIVATIKFANGSAGCLIHGDGGMACYASKFYFEVFGGQQSATLHDRCHKATVWQAPGDPETWTLDEAGSADPEGMVAQVQAFADCLRSGKPCMPGPAEGTQAAMITEAIFESVRSGSPVSL